MLVPGPIFVLRGRRCGFRGLDLRGIWRGWEGNCGRFGMGLGLVVGNLEGGIRIVGWVVLQGY